MGEVGPAGDEETAAASSEMRAGGGWTAGWRRLKLACRLLMERPAQFFRGANRGARGLFWPDLN